MLGAGALRLYRWRFFNRLAVGCLRKQPTGVGRKRAAYQSLKSGESAGNQLSPISSCGNLAPLSRRLYLPENRFSSVSRPFYNVSWTASPLFYDGRGFHLTTTISLRRLVLRFDYARGGGERRRRKSAKSLQVRVVQLRGTGERHYATLSHFGQYCAFASRFFRKLGGRAWRSDDQSGALRTLC